MECLCPKAPSYLEQYKKISQCYRCLQQFHSDCYWSPEKGQEFQCPFCYIRDCLPHKDVKDILFVGYLPILKKQRNQYQVNFTLDPKIKANRGIYLEARCLKFNQKNRYEISWPDNGSLSIGKMKIYQFKPLLNNSPLKRRVDEPIRLDKSKLQIENEVTIEEKSISETGYKANKKCIHLIAIMIVSELSGGQVVAKFQNNMIPVHQSKQALRQKMLSSVEITIQKVSVSLKCQYFGGRMKLPAKSSLCKPHHIQPFDLTNFIISSINAQNSTRRWKCPICDRRAYDLVVDKYILDLMALNKDTNQILFKVDGEPEMIENKDYSESSDSHEVFKFEKVEKIQQVIDLEDQDVQPSALIEEKKKSNDKLVLISDDDSCLLQRGHTEKKKTLKSNLRKTEENVLSKKRKIKDGVIVCIPVQRYNATIQIPDSDDELIYEKTIKVNKNKIAGSDKKNKQEQFPNQKLKKIQKVLLKGHNIQASQHHLKTINTTNPIVQNTVKNFIKDSEKFHSKGENLKAVFEKKGLKCVISIDSENQESTFTQQVVKKLTAMLYQHKKHGQEIGKIEIFNQDQQIFEAIDQKILLFYDAK